VSPVRFRITSSSHVRSNLQMPGVVVKNRLRVVHHGPPKHEPRRFECFGRCHGFRSRKCSQSGTL